MPKIVNLTFIPKKTVECIGANQFNKQLFRKDDRPAKVGSGGFYMTPRQRDVYIFIKYFWDIYGYSPTFAEIASGMNLKSKSNVQRVVGRLVEMGLVKRDGRRGRTIRRHRALDRTDV